MRRSLVLSGFTSAIVAVTVLGLGAASTSESAVRPHQVGRLSNRQITVTATSIDGLHLGDPVGWTILHWGRPKQYFPGAGGGGSLYWRAPRGDTLGARADFDARGAIVRLEWFVSFRTTHGDSNGASESSVLHAWKGSRARAVGSYVSVRNVVAARLPKRRWLVFSFYLGHLAGAALVGTDDRDSCHVAACYRS